MQKIVYLVLLIWASPLSSNGQSRAEQLVGRWQLNVEKTFNALPADRPTMNDSLQTEMKAVMASQEFEFTADRRFIAKIGPSKSYQGVWSLAKAGQGLILTYDQGPEFRQYIHRLDDDELVLKLVERDDSPALFHFLHFSLINRP